MKDWIGNKRSAFTVIGATGHSKVQRPELDYYATDPKAVELLLEVEQFNNVLEPACGEGNISKVLKKHNIKVTSSDIIDRGYGEVRDFFTYTKWNGDIITNPPYKWALEFVTHALAIIPKRRKIAFFLKIQFVESKRRKRLFLENPPYRIYVSSSRLLCALNNNWERTISSAICYAWFVWIKGYKGDAILKWIN